MKILIVSYPGYGLISPSLRLANRLLKLGVAVTFSTNVTMVQLLEKETTTPQGITFAPFFVGHHLPTTTLQQRISDFATNGAPAVDEIITSAAATGQPFDHMVYTTITPWAATVANAHGLKSTQLWCQSATVLAVYYYYFHGYQELISGNNNNSAFQVNLPGLPPLTMSDLPSFFLPDSPKEHDFLLPIYKDHVDALKTSPRVLVNTFNKLEFGSLKAIEKIQFLPIGPFIGSEEKDSLPDDGSYINWLNSKPKKSVIYVSFASLSRLSSDQAEEMANGLLESGWPFLWAIRGSLKLSKIEELKKQGMIVDWCNQVEVLRNQAIGCFVMHCGWNSTVEALVAGVPIVAYPQFTDQLTNAKMIEDVWKTGVRVKRREGDGMVEGKEIKRCVEMVMGDCEMRGNAEKWKDLGEEALNNGGSYDVNLKVFLNGD